MTHMYENKDGFYCHKRLRIVDMGQLKNGSMKKWRHGFCRHFFVFFLMLPLYIFADEGIRP